MLLRFNKDKDVWELAKVMKIKAEIRLEFETSERKEIIAKIQETNHLETDEDVQNYFKEQFLSKQFNDWMMVNLGLDKTTVKEVLNVQLEKENKSCKACIDEIITE